MDEDRYEIRLSGSGGQGMILASVILAEAATLEAENYVCQAQSYGPEARGGDNGKFRFCRSACLRFYKQIFLSD